MGFARITKERHHCRGVALSPDLAVVCVTELLTRVGCPTRVIPSRHMVLNVTEKKLADILGPVFSGLDWNADAIRVDFWDGSSIGSSDAKANVRIKSPEAFRHMVYAPGELGLA